MNNRQNQLISVIGEKAVHLLWNESFEGKANGVRHLHRVQRIAEFLWEKEGGDEFLIRAGAWVHDVSLAHGHDYDPERVAELTRAFLKQFERLREDETERIVACVEGHEFGGESLIHEAKIIHDADVLDKAGLLGALRHIWKMTNMLEKRLLKDEHDLNKLESHLMERQDRLYTETARRLANQLRGPVDLFFRDRPFALETMTWVSSLANEGIITERVAEALVSCRDHPCLRGLKDQLECRYLGTP